MLANIKQIIKHVNTSFSCPNKRKNVIWIPTRPYLGSPKENKRNINFSAFWILTVSLTFDSPINSVMFTFRVFWLSNHKNSNNFFRLTNRLNVCLSFVLFFGFIRTFLSKDSRSRRWTTWFIKYVSGWNIDWWIRLNVELWRESDIETFFWCWREKDGQKLKRKATFQMWILTYSIKVYL